MLTQADNDYLCRVGPGMPMGNLLRRFWMPAIIANELPEPDCAPLRVRLLGEDLVAWRNTDGSVGVMQNACPHRGASMFFGRNEENGLRCVYHGWKFDVTGACTDMPNEPAESNFKHKIHATAYPSYEFGGLVWIYMGPADKQPSAPPALDWCLVTDEQRHLRKWIQKSNYAQGLEGNIDSSHVGFLHRRFEAVNSTPGRRGNLVVDNLAPQITVRETEFGFIYGARRDGPDANHYWRLTPFLMPGYTGVPSPVWPRGCHAVVPRDDHSTWWFEVIYDPTAPIKEERKQNGLRVIPGTWNTFANRDNDYTIDRELQRTGNFTGIANVREQDMAIVETMGPVLDRTVEHLGSSDTAIIAYRRLMIRAARQLQQGIEPFCAQHPEFYRVRTLDVLDESDQLGIVIDHHLQDVVLGV